MAKHGGKNPLRVGTLQGEFIGVADAGGFDLHQHLALTRAFEVDGFQAERGAGGARDSGTGFQALVSSRRSARMVRAIRARINGGG